MAKWDGTPRDDRELQFWRDAYLTVARIELDRERPGSQKGIDKRLLTACDTADMMLGHFQTTIHCMEDFQEEFKKDSAA